ncbi:DoxX family protein [Hymenobacter negativus]|uniref:DoxX family protein n=1 Tax=Hymenobacter negativus TaxID=2795026 RepID=A0ABS3QG73_9BACT|nr:DoxX family protein [Hymenobacter negativus]MBO2009978.1 DoxX family protein [Hymenobacter negativus]
MNTLRTWPTVLLAPSSSELGTDFALLVFRLLAGFALFRVHGLDKLLHFQHEAATIPDPFGLGGQFNAAFAVFSDVVCALLVMLGLLARPAALGVLSTTLVGLLVVHLHDSWDLKDAPLTYATMFLLVLLAGPGRFSLDAQLARRRSS